MAKNTISRRKLLKLGGAALVSSYLGVHTARAAQPTAKKLAGNVRIGLILPTQTGMSAVRASEFQVAADAARAGALLAEEEFGSPYASEEGVLQVRLTTAPDREAAVRAAERMTAIEDIYAFIGGYGDDTAIALSQLAAKRQIPFFNIGSSLEDLRGAACNRYTFHVEASDSMYLDVLTQWYAKDGPQKWLYVYLDSPRYQQLYATAQASLAKYEAAGKEVGAVALPADTLDFSSAFGAIQEAKPDVVMMLVDSVSQLNIMGEMANARLNPEPQFAGIAFPTTQTRTFMVASRNTAPRAGTGYRAVLWDPQLKEHGAKALNQRFSERWGVPMDGPAWAGYQSVKVIYQAALAAGSTAADKLIPFLEQEDATFNVQKGVDLSFRPWDHQLRQVIYLDKLNKNAKSALDLAKPVGQMPEISSAQNASEALDLLGTAAAASGCKL